MIFSVHARKTTVFLNEQVSMFPQLTLKMIIKIFKLTPFMMGLELILEQSRLQPIYSVENEPTYFKRLHFESKGAL